MKYLQEYIDFKDNKIPMGKRKLQYIKWLCKAKHYSISHAINTANIIFGMKKDGYLKEPQWYEYEEEKEDIFKDTYGNEYNIGDRVQEYNYICEHCNSNDCYLLYVGDGEWLEDCSRGNYL